MMRTATTALVLAVVTQLPASPISVVNPTEPITWTLLGFAILTTLVLAGINLVHQVVDYFGPTIAHRRAERQAAEINARRQADWDFWTKVEARPTSPARRVVATQMLDYLREA
jgi:hypothetical protein